MFFIVLTEGARLLYNKGNCFGVDFLKDIYIERCATYEKTEVCAAMKALVSDNGLLDFVKPDMTIGIKANLVSFMKPETAATTHPEVLSALCTLITDRGAKCIIGDSPGGLYNSAFVGKVYDLTGMKNLEREGVSLNRNFEQSSANFDKACVAKTFQYTSWLDECDAIINFCKLKTHGMMCMSAAAKNIFGIVPGTLKPEYHFRFSNPADFARMIIDLNEYVKPALSICDAVIGMEGNGPTAGRPREIGCIMASSCPHKLDLVCAEIIGLDAQRVPTLAAAKERGLIDGDVSCLDINADIEEFKVADFRNIEEQKGVLFQGNGSILATVFSNVAKAALSAKPVLDKDECVGCAECYKICPAKAIQMKDKKPYIDRKKCIKCFCCQEFCPKGALKVKRPVIARILNK